MNGSPTRTELVDARRAGFDANLVKPVQLPTLRQTLETLISEAKAASLRKLRE